MLRIHSLSLLVGGLLVIGCNTSTNPVDGPQGIAVSPDWQTARFKIEGFKKSNSGAT